MPDLPPIRTTPERLREALGDVTGALTSVGALVVAQGHEAFERQMLGDVVWPERYPAMKEPFINLMPVLAKAGEGRTPTADDFRRRPALGGVNSELSHSLAFRVSGNGVEIGTARGDLKPALMQFGGFSTIEITDTTRATLGEWLSRSQGRRSSRVGSERTYGEMPTWIAGGLSKRKVPGAPTTVAGDYFRKLAFIFDGRTSYSQGVYPRPFIGYTDETQEEVERSMHDWLSAAVA